MTDTTISMLIGACLCGFGCFFFEDVAEVYLVELIRDGDACGKEKTAFSTANPSQKLISCVRSSAWVCNISCLIQFPVWIFSDIAEMSAVCFCASLVVSPLTARQALQGLPQLFALLQDVVELVEVPALPPVPGRVLDRPRHWTETQLLTLIF